MRFKWKSDKIWKGNDLVCLDQQEQVCARFEASSWALHKDGKFEVWPFVDGVLMDEVIVTGLAMVEMQKRTNRSVASAVQ